MIFEIPHGTCEINLEYSPEKDKPTVPRWKCLAIVRTVDLLGICGAAYGTTELDAAAGALTMVADSVHRSRAVDDQAAERTRQVVETLRERRRELSRSGSLSFISDEDKAMAKKSAAEPEAAPKKKRANQKPLPGMEDKRIKELDVAIEKYKDARDERMEATQAEVEAKKKLMGLMKEHKMTVYRSADAELQAEIVVEEEGVKVKKWSPKLPAEE